jgi:hypothetical protein
MSYAVRQFFLNGGNEAWVVRVAKSPRAASAELENDDGDKVLKLTALNEETPSGRPLEAGRRGDE